MAMTCLETIQAYALRSVGIGERLLPRDDFTLCQHFTLIGSGLIWNVYFGVLALLFGFFLANALALANFLSNHASVEKVYYPGLSHHETHEIACKQMAYFGGMLSFELKGGIEAARKCINKLTIATLAPTLGDVNTLIMHPFTMSHRNVPIDVREKFGISAGLIRVSVGIESEEDLIHDFRQSLCD